MNDNFPNISFSVLTRLMASVNHFGDMAISPNTHPLHKFMRAAFYQPTKRM